MQFNDSDGESVGDDDTRRARRKLDAPIKVTKARVKTVKSERSMPRNSSKIDNSVCVICLLDIDVVKDCALLDSCPHIFHYTCIRKWSKVKNSCPQCRKPFIKIEKIEVNEDGVDAMATTTNAKLGGFGLSLGYQFMWVVLQTFQFPQSIVEKFIDKYGCSYKRANYRIEEYRKFILLSAICPTTVTPSKQIGYMWYLHFSTAPDNYIRLIDLLRNSINIAWKNSFEKAKPKFEVSPYQAFHGDRTKVTARYKKGLDLYVNIFGVPSSSMWPTEEDFRPLSVPKDGDWPKKTESRRKRQSFSRMSTTQRHAADARWHVCKNLMTKSLGVLLGAALLMNLATGVSVTRGFQTMSLRPDCEYFVARGIKAEIGFLKWSYDNPEFIPNNQSSSVWGRVYPLGIIVWIISWFAILCTFVAFLLVMLMLRLPANRRKLTRRQIVVILMSFVCWALLFITSVVYQIVFDIEASDSGSVIGKCSAENTPSYGIASPWLGALLYAFIAIWSQILSPHPRFQPCYVKYCGCICVQAKRRLESTPFGDDGDDYFDETGDDEDVRVDV